MLVYRKFKFNFVAKYVLFVLNCSKYEYVLIGTFQKPFRTHAVLNMQTLVFSSSLHIRYNTVVHIVNMNNNNNNKLLLIAIFSRAVCKHIYSCVFQRLQCTRSLHSYSFDGLSKTQSSMVFFPNCT